jgi:uncharacterized protein
MICRTLHRVGTAECIACQNVGASAAFAHPTNCVNFIGIRFRTDNPPMCRATVAKWLAQILVRTYRLTLSPLLGTNCRHLPTCSEYAEEAFARHGFWAGGWMTFARLMRCHPWGTAGLDFVPAAKPACARWYMPWRYGRWRGTNTVPPR